MSVTTHMNNGFAKYTHPTYNEIQLACRHIAEFIHYNDSGIGKVDNIVGITRGGLMPAVELSHLMNIPMETVNYSSKDGKGDDKNHKNELPNVKGHSILLVDDICDSGHTLKELKEIYEDRGYNVFTAVIYYKTQTKPVFNPDVWAVNISQNFGWIIFPHETQ